VIGALRAIRAILRTGVSGSPTLAQLTQTSPLVKASGSAAAIKASAARPGAAAPEAASGW